MSNSAPLLRLSLSLRGTLTPAAIPVTSYYYQSVPLNSPYHINNTSNTITAATQQSNTMISNSNNTVLLMPFLLATTTLSTLKLASSKDPLSLLNVAARRPSYQHLNIPYNNTCKNIELYHKLN